MKVIMMMATTADGKIAKDNKQFADWTSREDKKLFVEVSKACGVVIMGENTFKTFPAPLKDRLNVVFSLQPAPTDTPPNVRYVQGEPQPILDELAKDGYEAVLLGGGARINTLFLEKGLIDEIYLTVEPKIFGSGLSLFDQPLEAELQLLESRPLNENTVLLHYAVKK